MKGGIFLRHDETIKRTVSIAFTKRKAVVSGAHGTIPEKEWN